MKAQRFSSGVRPSGALHLGHYFGAIRPHLARQDDAYYFIADYHALASPTEPLPLVERVHEVAATYLALGLDPARAALFRQSDIPEVTELTWLLLTTTPMGLLERAVVYKDRLARSAPASAGLFAYPALMAADILAYDTDVVAIGPDQRQHLEMTQDMAGYFNNTYGVVFKKPEYMLGTHTSVPGLDGAKMSAAYGNHIPLFATGEALRERVMAIRTDSKAWPRPRIRRAARCSRCTRCSPPPRLAPSSAIATRAAAMATATPRRRWPRSSRSTSPTPAPARPVSTPTTSAPRSTPVRPARARWPAPSSIAPAVPRASPLDPEPP